MLLLLLSAGYDGREKSAYLLFYDHDRHRIVRWKNPGNYKPYAIYPSTLRNAVKRLVGLSEKIVSMRERVRRDPITGRDRVVTEVVVDDPLAIGGRRDSLRDKVDLLEADIKFHQNYIIDMGLQVGAYYRLTRVGPARVYSSITGEVTDILGSSRLGSDSMRLAELLGEPIPEFRVLAIDIEVATTGRYIPDPEVAMDKIIAISFCSGDMRKVLVLGDSRMRKRICDIDVEVFDSDGRMLIRALKIMRNYPIIITFNGDDFDLKYMRKRAERLGIGDYLSDLIIKRNGVDASWGIHIDLYKVFNNHALKVYAFKDRYHGSNLDEVSEALLGESKEGIDFSNYTLEDLVRYSFRDAYLTYRLATFRDQYVMKLLVTIARVANMPIDDVVRTSISNWVRNKLIEYHRREGMLVPNPEDISRKPVYTSAESVTGKKYIGAIVIDPVPGIHFNVYVIDFASLYPSIIKEYNISYETVNCPHDECRDNIVPGSNGTYICREWRGLMSRFVGSIRDIRVRVFKPLSKNSRNNRDFFDAVQGILKVFINASYGVVGSEAFQFYYLPAAEAVTLYGRHAIMRTVEMARELGLNVIYGDTDSIFVEDPDEERVEELIRRVRDELHLDLDVDKVYRYVVLSSAKKNYFGVLRDGAIDVKGFAGKKRNTPPFIRGVFFRVLEELSKIRTREDFEGLRDRIIRIEREAEEALRNGDYEIGELAISVTLNKEIEEYSKTTPQHVKAAMKLLRNGYRVGKGYVIRFVKTRDELGATPVELVKSKKQVDVDKYIELMRSALSHIFEVMGISSDDLRASRHRTLDEFFKFR